MTSEKLEGLAAYAFSALLILVGIGLGVLLVYLFGWRPQ